MTEPIEDPEPEPQPEPEPESAPTLFPELAQAVPLPLPELGYDRMMVWLSVEPWLSADRKVLDGRAHEAALIADNVIDMSHAQAGATAVNGGVGPRWLRNGWSVAPDVVARSASDVTGVLGLGNPGAALANEFPEPEHSLVLDNYRPVAGSPLIGAGIDGATIGALEPDGVTPPPPPPPPPPVVVDWATLRGMVAAAATYLAATGANVAEAQKHADGAAALLNLAMLRLADAQQEQTRAAAEMAALLAKMNEYQQAA